MDKDEMKNKYTERAKIFQQAMESCKSSSPMDCIEWFADRIAELEKENAELKNKLEHRNCLDCSNHSSNLRMRNLELEKENAELKEDNSEWEKASDKWKSVYEITNNQLTNAKEIIRSLYFVIQVRIDYKGNIPLEDEMYRANQFLNSEVEK